MSWFEYGVPDEKKRHLRKGVMLRVGQIPAPLARAARRMMRTKDDWVDWSSGPTLQWSTHSKVVDCATQFSTFSCLRTRSGFARVILGAGTRTRKSRPEPSIEHRRQQMSTGFRLSNYEFAFSSKAELLEKLAKYKIVEGTINPAQPLDVGSKMFPLFDGRNTLWALPNDEDKISGFVVFSETLNNPATIIDAIEEVSGDTVLSEHDEGFFEDEDEDDE